MADVGEESITTRGCFVELFVSTVPVPTDRRGARHEPNTVGQRTFDVLEQ
jgi:hypothetical protein